MMKKSVGSTKIYIPAQSATPAPPVGSALGQYGIKLMDFCKEFNARTQNINKGDPVPTIVTIYEDKSFSIELKTTPTGYLVRKMCKTDKAGRHVLSRKDLEQIITIKKPDLTGTTHTALVNTIAGTLRSMKVTLVEEY